MVSLFLELSIFINIRADLNITPVSANVGVKLRDFYKLIVGIFRSVSCGAFFKVFNGVKTARNLIDEIIITDLFIFAKSAFLFRDFLTACFELDTNLEVLGVLMVIMALRRA